MYIYTHKISIYHKTLPQKFMFIIRVWLGIVYLTESENFLLKVGRYEKWEK